MSVRIGINPLSWTNDDMPELGGDTPLETCLSEAREAGYAGIEMGHKFPRTYDALNPLLTAHRLRLVSGWYGSRLLERSADDEITAVQGHLDLLSRMGANVMVFAEVTGSVHTERGIPLSARPRLSDEDWPRFADALSRVAEHLAGAGVTMAYHHHMGTVVQSEEEIDRLMAASGSAVGLLLDTAHLVFAGASPNDVIGRHGARINHVHCKDVRADELAHARAADRSFLDSVLAGVFTVPGDGSLDFSSILQALAELDYAGWLVVEAEQDPAKAHPLTYARMGFEALSAHVADAGLGRMEA
ncbi:MAG: myo-inosose-2 dehydratase [Rhodospirillales bacterium]|jgi:inosose dehydratase|nr:myo-inosose-2 dehydratase [Rhodospirillales bacterium]